MRAAILNAYPRIGDVPGEQGLRRAIARLDSGDASEEDVRAEERRAAAVALREQEAAGLDLGTDGLVSWADPVSHVPRRWEGVQVTGLLRWFDTNTYFRQPAVVGPVRRRGPVLVGEFEGARSTASRPVKAVVPGPWTLATHAKRADGVDAAALARELTPLLAAEVAALAEAGARWIQVDEPALVRESGVPAAVGEAAGAFARAKGDAHLILAAYFGGVGRFLPDLLALPFDAFALDLVQGRETLGALRRTRTSKGLHLGLVDARNTRLEDPDAVAAAAREVAEATGSPDVWLTTSNSLEFLPHPRARDKLAILSKAARE